MKNTKTLIFAATFVTAIVTGPNVRADNLASAAALASASVHRLIVASPHGLEEFPWLLREASSRTEKAAGSETALSAVKKNRALAASPRIREQFPELARVGWFSSDLSSKPTTRPSDFGWVIKNKAFANSPRTREEFPWLARGYTAPPGNESIQVAPLK